MDIDSIDIDPAAIEGGVWIGGIPEFGDVQFLVRGLTSPQADKLRKRLTRSLTREQKEADGGPNNEAALEIGGKVLLDAVLLDWKGITQNGKAVPYSRKQAEKWLTDPVKRRFGDAVAWAASQVDKGRAADTEEAAGNSEQP